MSTSKITDQISALLEAGATEEDVLNAFRALKHKAEKEAARTAAIENKRKEVIEKVLDYVTFVTGQKPTKEEENSLRKYIQEVLVCAEGLATKKEESKEKITKRGWRNGKEMSDAEINEIFDKFWKGIF